MNTISKLEPSDFSLAYTIEKRSHQFPWSEKTFYSNQGDRYLNYKISLNDKLVGFCIIQIVVDEATLFNIAIHPDFQQKGLANALLSYAISELLTKNISTLWLEVRASNLPAIKLYEQLGFNEISIRPNYYPTKDNQREDAIIMAYMLGFA